MLNWFANDMGLHEEKKITYLSLSLSLSLSRKQCHLMDVDGRSNSKYKVHKMLCLVEMNDLDIFKANNV